MKYGTGSKNDGRKFYHRKIITASMIKKLLEDIKIFDGTDSFLYIEENVNFVKLAICLLNEYIDEAPFDNPLASECREAINVLYKHRDYLNSKRRELNKRISNNGNADPAVTNEVEFIPYDSVVNAIITRVKNVDFITDIDKYDRVTLEVSGKFVLDIRLGKDAGNYDTTTGTLWFEFEDGRVDYNDSITLTIGVLNILDDMIYKIITDYTLKDKTEIVIGFYHKFSEQDGGLYRIPLGGSITFSLFDARSILGLRPYAKNNVTYSFSKNYDLVKQH